MNVIQVSRLLNDNNIPTISTDTSLEEKRDQGENFYKLRLNNNKWEFLFISEVNDEEKVLETFAIEANASKYYYLFQLERYLTKKIYFSF